MANFALNRFDYYRCPTCKNKLTSVKAHSGADFLHCQTGHSFPIHDDMVHFTHSDKQTEEQQESAVYYEKTASIYDDIADLSFRIQCQDETSTRRSFIDLLKLKPNAKVLEIACGTGRDSINIVEKLGPDGAFHGVDFSPAMLQRCRNKLRNVNTKTDFSVGSALNLPFADAHFDALFSFGGLNVFGDLSQCFSEMVRVCKPGARIVVGDESLAPWLYQSEYGRVLLANNPLFKHPLPLAHIPIEARQVRVQWVIGGVYYLIDFDVGQGEPPANFDIEIPGERGGTLRTRYFGKTEGLSLDTLELAKKARQKSGKSMHRWLDDVVRDAASRALSSPESSS
jgi:ubiquinone/menaquinone biosynthesis C-methylase UbiE